MSQNATELCLLLVDDIYGELTSRVFSTLMYNGRLSFQALLQRTSLSIKLLKHALVVLVQQHFALWYTTDEGSTYYEACWTSAYDLVRLGKLVRIIKDRFGQACGEVFKDLLLSGHARTEDLALSYSKGSGSRGAAVKGRDCAMHVKTVNGLPKIGNENQWIDADLFKEAFYTLSKEGFVIPVHESYLRSAEDNRSEAETLVKSLSAFRGELKGKQLKEDYLQAIEQKLNDWRFLAFKAPGLDDEGVDLLHERGKKRKREEDHPSANSQDKRRRPAVSTSLNAVELSHPVDLSSWIKDQLAFRVNYDKLLVVARNERLVELVNGRIGRNASIVYRELLRLLEKDLQCCNANPNKDGEDEDRDTLYNARVLSTIEIADGLADCEDIGGGVGHAEPHQINLDFITHRKAKRRKYGDEAEVSGEASSDEEDEESDEVENVYHDDHTMNKLPNGNGKLKSEVCVEKQDSLCDPSSSHSSEQARLEVTRQTLFLLAEHPYSFVSYKYSEPESWTVDFCSLSKYLILIELESIILSRYTENGLRIVRILHEKGKLDEKALASLALMNQKTMRSTLTLMHEAGHLELQEIPRDNARQASRTLFLWFFDMDRCRMKVLEETYKTMARCLQRINVEREEVRGLIEKAERTDVVGREDEFLSEGERVALEEWRRTEELLLGQVGRLDDLVAVLRDY